MQQYGKKPQSKIISQDTMLEQLRDIGRGISSTVKQDLVGGVATDALSSLFGSPKSGDLKPGQTVNISDNKPRQPSYERFMPSKWNKSENKVPAISLELINKLRQQETLVSQKIEEIRLELKELIRTLKTVDKEIEKTVEERIIEPGIYHLNFLDRLKTILKLLRQNLSESASWLTIMRSRKKQRTYWSLYKKKGTEFGLNHERVVSTQVG